MTSHEPDQSVLPPFLYFDSLPAWRAEPAHAKPVARPHLPVAMPRSTSKAGRARGPYPSRALLGVVALLGLCVAVVGWNAKPLPALPPELFGIDLRAEGPPPKFNITSAEAPRVRARPSEPDKPRVPLPSPRLQDLPPAAPKEVLPPPTVHVQVPAHPVEVPPLVEPAFLLPVEFHGPGSLECSCFHDMHRGETPMLRNWNTITLSSLVAVALAANSLPAAPPEGDKEGLKAIKESIDALNTTIGKLNDNLAKALDVQSDIKKVRDETDSAKLSLDNLKGAIRDLEGAVKDLKGELSKIPDRDISRFPPPDKGGFDDLQKRLLQIEIALAKLAESRISKSPPVATGRILLANQYPEEILFVVNNQPHKVAPFTTLVLDNHPAGIFEYEVISGLGSLKKNRPVLEPGKSFTITVR